MLTREQVDLLCEAIVLRAVDDYVNAPEPYVREDAERFFKGEDFSLFTTLDPQLLLTEMDRQIALRGDTPRHRGRPSNFRDRTEPLAAAMPV